MGAGRLILLLILVLVAVVLIVVVLRRGSAQRDAQRVEAAGLRTEADTLATTVAGQSAFADQAAQRAGLARAEAEDKAREAARLEAEAAEHRATVEATQRDYEATMRRADDIDPDVKESAFPAVADDGADEAEAAPATSGSTDAAPAPAAVGAGAAVTEEQPATMTRAERREARDAQTLVGAEDGSRSADAAAAPAGATAGAAAGAAGGAAGGAWAARGDDEGDAQSERIASAADFRDDVPDDPADDHAVPAEDHADASGDAPARERAEVYPEDATGTGRDMSDDTRTDADTRTDTEHASNDDGLETGGAAAAASAGAGAGGAYAATRAMHDETADDTVDVGKEGGDTAAGSTGDLSQDVESPRGEWGGPRADEAAEMTIVEPEAYAATEPLLASEQTAPAEAGAAVAETDDADRSPADVAEESTQERYDPTPTRDWAADEGELLEENHDRGDRLEAERDDLARAGDDTGGGPASDDAATATAADGAATTTASEGRRVSGFDELRDGGFGVGSAAPLHDGAQPLDHPVAAYRDTMTYRVPGDSGYDEAEPHVWFYDEGAAERSGFRRSEG